MSRDGKKRYTRSPRNPRKPWQIKREFLVELGRVGYLTLAAKACDITPRSIHRWRKADPKFAAAVLQVLADASDRRKERLEAELERRVFDPNLAHVPAYIFGRLKAEMPEKYGDRAAVLVTGQATSLTAADYAQLSSRLVGALRVGMPPRGDLATKAEDNGRKNGAKR